MENKAFRRKEDWYYNQFKPGIASLIPDGPHAVLDLGCGVGILGRKLKGLDKARELVGVEIFKEAADEAAHYYEKVHHGDLEQMTLDYENYFDFVICGDILEHLIDPWKMLLNIYRWLKSSGRIVVSIPNIRYWRILRDLILFGQWKYLDGGILDRTHLRFFTKASFLKAMSDTGFIVEYNRFDVNGVKHKYFNTITFRMFEEFLGSQIIVVGKK